MNVAELLKCIGVLRSKSENNKLIAFVGAGVSRNVSGMPSWYDLIKAMADAIGYSKCNTCKHKTDQCEGDCKFKSEYSTDEFLKIPQFVYNTDKELYDKIIEDNISDVVVDAPLSKAIFQINPAHIITTNYDTLLENSKSIFCEQYDVVYKDCHLLDSEKNKYIIKMHGDINNKQTIVLKESDYLDYSQKHVLIEMFLKALLADHTLLFLGYSLNDYNIKLILSWLNHIRTQNNVISSEKRVGYIVLDEEEVDKNKLTYFEKNNIGVINIHQMLLIEGIPSELTYDEGKRLYSFLSVIGDESLELNLSYEDVYNNAIDFFKCHKYINCDQICLHLQIKGYEFVDRELIVSAANDYKRIIEFLKSENVNVANLKQILCNANISSIVFYNHEEHKKEKFEINDFSSELSSNSFFNLYYINDYVALNSELETKSAGVLEKCFYDTIVNGYSCEMLEELESVNISDLTQSEKVAYLFNYNAIRRIIYFTNSDGKVTEFINNIAINKERNIYKPYINVFSGNKDKINLLNEYFNKLKKDFIIKQRFIGCSCLRYLYKIKTVAIDEYTFYFANNLFFIDYSDLKTILKFYIESIVYTNKDFYESDDDSKKEKYKMDQIDFDIITKFIPTRDLYNLIIEHNVNNFKIDADIVWHMINCVKNISKSIITLSLYQRSDLAVDILMNSFLILSRTVLTDDQISEIKSVVVELINDSLFRKYFFSIRLNDWRINIKVLSDFVSKLELVVNFKVIEEVILSERFFEYYININSYYFSKFVKSVIDMDKLCEIQNDIDEIIDSLEEKEKILAIDLLRDYVIEEKLKTKYKEFLSEHLLDIKSSILIDFVFKDWILLSEQNTKDLLEKTIALNEKNKGVRYIPDPVETKLELLYILYIMGKIDSLEPLKDLADTRPHLQFLINPDDFDYTQVDFSDYMWENFVRRDHLRIKFIEHKDILIPIIKKKIELDQASECDRKMLYGYLLSEDEII